MTWAESVDQSLCFGWIDGVRRSVDASAYMIRFTPRRAASKWSQKNLARLDELRGLGLVRPEGEAAFAARGETVVAWYSQENDLMPFDEDALRRFQADEAAWNYFERQAPSYRKAATNLGHERQAGRDPRPPPRCADREVSRRRGDIGSQPARAPPLTSRTGRRGRAEGPFQVGQSVQPGSVDDGRITCQRLAVGAVNPLTGLSVPGRRLSGLRVVQLIVHVPQPAAILQ